LKKSKIYFASDFHLGIPDYKSSLIREKKLVNWLDMISGNADEIFLMGDIFDFWFEYKHVIPKGYVRLLGKIAELTDKGIPVNIFKGNHDVWAFDYLSKELNVTLHRKPVIREFDGKKFFLAHGDGLGPGDNGYKFLKKVFEFKPNQFLFRWLHPDIGCWLGLYFSKQSRLANLAKYKKELQEENHDELKYDMLMHYASRKSDENPEIDYFVFGHRHIPVHEKVGDKAEMIVLGDWINYFSYGVFEDGKMNLKYFKD
jgi:UDP-2,3-diacylglucosamine hydrolase|tara:strand:+ start:169 stop:939 length:771 start_codon:yes stop_codon:yes gene_type:complete